MTAVRHRVQQQARGTVIVGEQNVDPSIVIHVVESRRAAGLQGLQVRSGRSRHVLEALPRAQIAQQQFPFTIRKPLTAPLLHRHDPDSSIGAEQAEKSAILHVERADAEPGIGQGDVG
jgi:hypothetical protein